MSESHFVSSFISKASEKSRVLEYLDFREKDNYDRCWLSVVDILTHEVVSDRALCYIGRAETLFPDEPNLKLVAQHIADSSGPSGANSEYVLKLQQALASHHLSDPYIYEICAWLKTMDI